MADLTFKDNLNGVNRKLIDNGDGTYSELVSNGGTTNDFRVSFSKTIANNVDTEFFSIIGALGSGMTVGQASSIVYCDWHHSQRRDGRTKQPRI